MVIWPWSRFRLLIEQCDSLRVANTDVNERYRLLYKRYETVSSECHQYRERYRKTNDDLHDIQGKLALADRQIQFDDTVITSLRESLALARQDVRAMIEKLGESASQTVMKYLFESDPYKEDTTLPDTWETPEPDVVVVPEVIERKIDEASATPIEMIPDA